jgi:organic hydroperoxide reductase OsmC/OhrA
MSTYSAVVAWNRRDAAFVDGKYSRGHSWAFDGGVTVPASSSPHVVALPMSVEAAVDPEEAFVAALASCHMLFFLSLAAKRGLVVDRYEDRASGTMARNSAGKLAMTEVVLRPKATFGGRPATAEELEELHHRAHEECYLASSVTTRISVEPES